MKVKSKSEDAQSCQTLSEPADCSLPDCSVHGIFQARILEWGAIAFSSFGCSDLSTRRTGKREHVGGRDGGKGCSLGAYSVVRWRDGVTEGGHPGLRPLSWVTEFIR